MEIENKYKVKDLSINTDFNLHPYYKESIENYGEFSDTNIYNFDYKVIENENKFKDFFEEDYNTYMEHIDKLSTYYNKFEANYANDGKVYAKRLHISQIKNNVNLLNDIYDMLLPSVEKNIYNCHLKIIDINAYQNTVCKGCKEKSSWLWHFDNHPNEFVKMMIYITDVDENSGPLEILVDENESGVKLKSNRINKKDYSNKNFKPNKYFEDQYDGNRITNSAVSSLCDNGYKKKKILGKRGTIIIFSENLIHKANIATKNHRNIINSVISPSKIKKNKFLDFNYITDKRGYVKWLD